MTKFTCRLLALVFGVLCISGCVHSPKPISIGVSFGVGPAARWDQEKIYIEERAAELGAEIEVRLNRTDEPKTQSEDCYEMIDSGYFTKEQIYGENQ